MPQLRERASADALAAHHDQLSARRARAALERRLDQLEAERAAFNRTLVNVEQAVRWLPDAQRLQARRRLRALGLDEQPGAFQDFEALLDDAA